MIVRCRHCQSERALLFRTERSRDPFVMPKCCGQWMDVVLEPDRADLAASVDLSPSVEPQKDRT